MKEATHVEGLEPICILLNSTLNIEFVYVILEGIVNFSRMSFKPDAEVLRSEFDFPAEGEEMPRKYTAVHEEDGDVTIEMKQIEIAEFDSWEPNE